MDPFTGTSELFPLYLFTDEDPLEFELPPHKRQKLSQAKHKVANAQVVKQMDRVEIDHLKTLNDLLSNRISILNKELEECNRELLQKNK